MIRITRSTLGPLVGMVVIGLLMAGALVLADRQGTMQITADATVQHRAEAVMGAAGISRAALNEALVLSSARERGIVSDQAVAESVEDYRRSLDDLSRKVATLQATLDGIEVDRLLSELVRAGEGAAGAIVAGQEGEARSITTSEFEPAYESLVSTVAAERDARAQHIAAVRHDVGRVANAARFMVAFLIPAGAIYGFHRALRNRQERTALQSDLARERGLRREKDRFVAAVSHELRTPLSAVVGFAEVLREGRHDFNAGERNEFIELLADQANATSHILDDLLVAARSDLGELTVASEDVDVRRVVERVTEGWGRKERARVTIRGGALARADDPRTCQVLRNLLDNALEYGGDHVEVVITDSSPNVVVEVIDDGEGIPAQAEARVFESYERVGRVSGQPGSLGLGLFVSRLLARKMGGDLSYERRDGHSIFTLSLPEAEGDAPLWLPERVIDPRAGHPSEKAVLEVIEAGGPNIVFQPIVDMRAGRDRPRRSLGYEALARFPFGSPLEWFEMAGEAGVRLELELASIRAAIRAFAGMGDDPFLTVNVSDDTLVSSRLPEALSGMDPSRIILELSEEASIRSYEATRQALAGLVSLGYRLALDDVGAGETDLWHVVRLRPAMVKLDVALTKDVDENYDGRALVHGLAVFAADLGAMVVAEGIERESEALALLQLGVHLGQGYLLGRPVPFDELATALADATTAGGVI